MWIIAMWLAIGAVAGILGFIALCLVADHVDSVQNRKRTVIRAQQRSAEAQMQSTVQDTITEMLNAALGNR